MASSFFLVFSIFFLSCLKEIALMDDATRAFVVILSFRMPVHQTLLFDSSFQNIFLGLEVFNVGQQGHQIYTAKGWEGWFTL